jgi:hypothetical protein
MGVKPFFETPAQMEKVMDQYFDNCTKNNKPFTVCGLSAACGFASRQSFFDYIENKTGFTDTIKKAKYKIEQYLEEQLAGGRQVAGLIFNLKNNFGWVDKQEINTHITGELSLSDVLQQGKKGK